jgi:hypothetical protein
MLMGEAMRRIEWEKMPKPLKLLLLPFLPILAMLGWIMIVVAENKKSDRKSNGASLILKG